MGTLMYDSFNDILLILFKLIEKINIEFLKIELEIDNKDSFVELIKKNI